MTRLSKGSRQRWTRSLRTLLLWHATHLPVSILRVFLSSQIALIFLQRDLNGARVWSIMLKSLQLWIPPPVLYATLKIDTWQIQESAPFLPETHFFPLLFHFYSLLILKPSVSCCCWGLTQSHSSLQKLLHLSAAAATASTLSPSPTLRSSDFLPPSWMPLMVFIAVSLC